MFKARNFEIETYLHGLLFMKFDMKSGELVMKMAIT